MRDLLDRYQYSLLILALAHFIMIPMWDSMMAVPTSLVIVSSYSFVILTGMNVAEGRRLKWSVFVVGILTLLCIWIEFVLGWADLMVLVRILLTLVLFSLLFYVLIINVLRSEEICFDMIVAVMSGFLFLGILGGIVLELLEFSSPGSLQFAVDTGRYGFYYFSFISLTSVGFGDVVPSTPIAQSVTVLIGLLGQFYLAFGVTVFVGKFLSGSNS